jgi:PIN domain nuclease of toxin-antitoxin system
VSKYVLDASALLALLNNETGANVVREILPDAIISAVNFSEVIAWLTRIHIPDDEISDILDVLGLTIIPFDKELAYKTGQMAEMTKPLGLSLGDRACLALAIKFNAIAVTADKIWGNLGNMVQIQIIR